MRLFQQHTAHFYYCQVECHLLIICQSFTIQQIYPLIKLVSICQSEAIVNKSQFSSKASSGCFLLNPVVPCSRTLLFFLMFTHHRQIAKCKVSREYMGCYPLLKQPVPQGVILEHLFPQTPPENQ